MTTAETLARVLVCPRDRASLAVSGEDRLVCGTCGAEYCRGSHGYFDFTGQADLAAIETTSEEYAEDQRTNKRRFYDDYLKPWLDAGSAKRILEVGTGLGMEISFLLAENREAYGIDVPCLTRFWTRLGNDPRHFLCSDGAAMPFPSGFFDAVFTLGVIEHIGAVTGHYTLGADYQENRRAFARELLRVTRPGGRLLVTCPNKAFPIDMAHEPADAATPAKSKRVRRWIYGKTGMTLHLPFGPYHLLSYGEIERLFVQDAGAASIEPLPLKGYFAFNRLASGPLGLLKRPISACINHMPRVLLASPLNPFLVVQVTK